MATIIAIANQKGGVGKTTTAVTLAGLWARAGNRVLLVDLDSQGNVADSLGMEAGRELTALLMPGLGLFTPSDSGREGLQVIRADKTTVDLKMALAGTQFREYCLVKALKRPAELYDLVVLDCAPSTDILHVAALAAADLLVVPTRLDQFAVKGVRDVIQSTIDLYRMQASKAEVAGILPTFYERQTRESQAQLENLVRVFNGKVLPPVPVDTEVREANRSGKMIMEYDAKARSLVGVEVKGAMVGGYEAVVGKLEEVWL